MAGTATMAATANTADTRREKVLSDYRKKLLEHREVEAKLKEGKSTRAGLISYK